jgi:septal ring factor EnvC (AmiA/AmiB activator)
MLVQTLKKHSVEFSLAGLACFVAGWYEGSDWREHVHAQSMKAIQEQLSDAHHASARWREKWEEEYKTRTCLDHDLKDLRKELVTAKWHRRDAEDQVKTLKAKVQQMEQDVRMAEEASKAALHDTTPAERASESTAQPVLPSSTPSPSSWIPFSWRRATSS